MIYDYLIIGAGFAGSIMAERLALGQNKKILIVEKRDHIGGNAYDEVDDHGILVHRYGPHIFHTNNKEVFDYLSRFTSWRNTLALSKRSRRGLQARIRSVSK